MRLPLAAILLFALLYSGVAEACRCEQRPLSEYFAAADFVAMGRLTESSENGQQRLLRFELLAAPYKGAADEQRRGSFVDVSTATSTASCGIQPDINATYVLFAALDDAGVLHIDSCSCTRVHLSTKLEEPVGFVDVPARFVAGQLNALFGLAVLKDVSANAPTPNTPKGDRLIGLLDLKALAHGGYMHLYEGPSSKAPVIGRIETYDDLDSREVGYEVSTAVVYAKTPGWYAVRHRSGRFGWLLAEASGTWFPYEELPVRRLAYLTGEWSGLTWPGAGTGIPIRSELNPPDGRQEYPVEVHESVSIGGAPWFRVTVLQDDPCSVATPKGRVSGWVPAYGRRGLPNVWVYSRGC